MGWTHERLEGLVSFASEPDPSAVMPGPEPNYDIAFENAWWACLEELAAPKSAGRCGELIEELDRAVDCFEELPLGAEDRVPAPRLIHALLDSSHMARFDNPARMLALARMARKLVQRCDETSAGGAAQLADLRAWAWGQFGNAMRVNGRLQEAERALAVAQEHAVAGTAAADLQIELLNWQGSLATYQRRFELALTLLHQAEALCHELNQEPLLPTCLVRRAIATVYAGQPEQAISILDRAIPLIDSADRRLLMAANHNLIYCYVEAGRLQEALALFPQTKSLGDELQDEVVKYRLYWQEGKILFELGLLEEAEAQFSHARQGFMERDLSYAAAVVSLDLAAVYVKLGLSAEVRRTIADILPIFSSLRVGRELLASLIQLQQAEDQTQALQLIRALSRELVAGPKLPPSV
jgi:tetratricopeptide (TPR) repeat protein